MKKLKDFELQCPACGAKLYLVDERLAIAQKILELIKSKLNDEKAAT